MGSFTVNSYALTEEEARETLKHLKEHYPRETFECWEIEPNKYGKYVVIQRCTCQGPNPKLKLIRKVNEK